MIVAGMAVDEFEYLWTGANPWGALVALDPRPGDSKPEYLVFDRRQRRLLLIEVEEVARAVVQNLLRAGVPILTPEELESWEEPGNRS